MQLRGNLFIKIFVGFWIMTIAILASWTLTSDYFDSRPLAPPNHEHRLAGPPHRFLLRTIYNLENLEPAALTEMIHKTHEKHDVDIFVLDKDGVDILGRKVPELASTVAAQLDGGRQRALHNTFRKRYLGHIIYRPESGLMRAVIVFNSPGRGFLNTVGGNKSLQIALAFLVSGLICFALSRVLTNRLQELRLASRRLANGELDTRLQVRERGGDETDELARDFNSMAQQLQQRIQAQKRMVTDVSHELRSPLARLRVALALVQESPQGSAKYLARIECEAERLEALIAQLLASQAQVVSLDDHIDIARLLEQLCIDANFEGQAERKSFLFSCGSAPATVRSSGDLLRKSFENILRNALIHTPPNSQVSVTLVADSDQFEVSIEDQGPGVPESELDALFDEFYRVDTARTRESGGYGLGLAIARRAISLHQGKITAQNTGNGLRVTVLLPREPDLETGRDS